MAEGSIYDRVRELTKQYLGVAMNLHAFRDGPATALAIEDPEHVLCASPILGNADPRITEKHYNQAKGIEAVREYQGEIIRQRRKAANNRRPPRKRP